MRRIQFYDSKIIHSIACSDPGWRRILCLCNIVDSTCRTSPWASSMISAQYRDPIMISPTHRSWKPMLVSKSKAIISIRLKQISILNQFEPTVFLTECLIQKSLDFYEYLNRRNVYVILSDLNDLIFWHFLAFGSKIEEWAERDCLNFWMFDCLWMTLRKILNF